MYRKCLNISSQFIKLQYQQCNRFSSSSAPQKFERKMTAVVLGIPKKMRSNPGFMKVDTPEFKNLFTTELKTLIDIFQRYGYELRIAGGAVRDILMHIEPKDIDLATTATPDEMKSMFDKEQVRMINAKGEKHGTITPRILNKVNFEVTTLRIDVRTDGRHAEVQFTTDWQLDANRRDLTINSMFLGFDGTVYDYFFGYDDLLKRLVVFVGDAAVRIQEDYLRILRYFRFYGRIAKHANNHDAETIKAIRENGAGLAQISGERIWCELQKILLGNFGCELMKEIIACGLASHCGLPTKPNIAELERVYKQLENFTSPHYAVLYLIAMLHNVDEAMLLHGRLKLSAFERDVMLFIVQQREHVDADFANLKMLQKLILQKNVNRAFIEQLLKYCNKVTLYKELTAWKSPRFPLNGNMLVENGCAQNKNLGVIMNHLKEIWIDSDFSINAEDLLQKQLPEILQKFKNDKAAEKTSHKRQRK